MYGFRNILKKETAGRRIFVGKIIGESIADWIEMICDKYKGKSFMIFFAPPNAVFAAPGLVRKVGNPVGAMLDNLCPSI